MLHIRATTTDDVITTYFWSPLAVDPAELDVNDPAAVMEAVSTGGDVYDSEAGDALGRDVLVSYTVTDDAGGVVAEYRATGDALLSGLELEAREARHALSELRDLFGGDESTTARTARAIIARVLEV